MINQLLDIVAPHHCYGCQKTGSLLCENCKYDIMSDGFSACVVCAKLAAVGICRTCETSYQKAWCVGERSGVLEAIIDGLKFERQVDAASLLATLLDEYLPILPPNTIVVSVPTVPSHVRRRGYDQTKLIAEQFARRRQLSITSLIERRDTTSQRGHGKRERFKQAEAAFICRQPLDSTLPYLIIDDVITTNATVRYAAQALRDAGANQVWVAVIAKQPLEEQ